MFKTSDIKDTLENRIDISMKNNLKSEFEDYSEWLKIFMSIPTTTTSNERSFLFI